MSERIVPLLRTERDDNTQYHLIADPAHLFVPNMAYAGAEIVRRLNRWHAARNERSVLAARGFGSGRGLIAVGPNFDEPIDFEEPK